MTIQQIHTKVEKIYSEKLINDLSKYLDELLIQQKSENKSTSKIIPVFGCAKGKFRMSKDFNDPIDHFSEYMPS